MTAETTTERPETCPLCGHRSEFKEAPDGRQAHTCLVCAHQWLVEPCNASGPAREYVNLAPTWEDAARIYALAWARGGHRPSLHNLERMGAGLDYVLSLHKLDPDQTAILAGILNGRGAHD